MQYQVHSPVSEMMGMETDEEHVSIEWKVSWQLGVKEYHNITCTTIHRRDLSDGRNQEGGCLCLGEKQHQTEFLVKGVELFRVNVSRVEIGRIYCPEIGYFTLYNGGRVQ